MKIDADIADKKCKLSPKCFWYSKGECYIAPTESCIKNKRL